jgi:hypothetical protein
MEAVEIMNVEFVWFVALGVLFGSMVRQVIKAHKLLDFISIIVVNTFIGALFNLVLFNIIEPNILKVFLASFAYSIFMWDWIVDYKW